MKPPTKEAVAEALSILMGSVNNENDSQFAFQEIPAAFVSLSSLPDNVEALTLAKSCINKELDRLITSMQHRRNLAAPIYRLPMEVLVMIFVHFAASSSLADGTSLLELTTVNKLWYDAIAYSPQLWTSLESWFTPKIARLVVQRSKNLPLSLVWDSPGYDESEQSELAEILELAVQNSLRLRSIEMTVPKGDKPNVRKLLESNMPHLEKLQVTLVGWFTDMGGARSGGFELSDGPPLRELSLDGTHLSSWSSPRLSGLVALELVAPRQPPSIEELSVILSNCTQLERLKLCNWDYTGPYTFQRLSDKPIILPHLKDFYAEAIYRHYFVALVTSVSAPSARNVSISTGFFACRINLLEDVFTPGNDQLATLLGLANSESQFPDNPIPISISVEKCKLQIEGYSNNEKRKISIEFSEELCAQVELEIDTTSSWRRETLDLLPWSRSLHQLSAHTAVVCRMVLKQLAQQTLDPTTGVTTWMCPNLTDIELCYMHSGDEVEELDGVALETLAHGRWSDRGAAEQLLEFTIRCEEEEYPSIWSRATLLKEAIPCLSIVDLE